MTATSSSYMILMNSWSGVTPLVTSIPVGLLGVLLGHISRRETGAHTLDFNSNPHTQKLTQRLLLDRLEERVGHLQIHVRVQQRTLHLPVYYAYRGGSERRDEYRHRVSVEPESVHPPLMPTSAYVPQRPVDVGLADGLLPRDALQRANQPRRDPVHHRHRHALGPHLPWLRRHGSAQGGVDGSIEESG